MASKTNCTINGVDYYRIRRNIGKTRNEKGAWVPVQKVFYGKNKKDAENQYEEYKKLRESGLVGTGDALFDSMFSFFMYEVFMVDDSFTSGTRERYESVYRNYIKTAPFDGQLLKDVKSFDIQKLYNDLDCSKSTLKAVNSLMQHFYKYMERQHVCIDITNSLVMPSKDKNPPAQEIVTWTDKEVRKIVNGLEGHRLRLLIILALNTGCRISELLALQYSDFENDQLHISKQLLGLVDFDGAEKGKRERRLENPKTENSIRDIPISKEVQEELRLHSVWHKEEMMKFNYRTNFIFTTKTGLTYDRHNIPTALKRYYKQIGVPYKSFHTYRHTFCTNLCLQGVKLETASKLLGHDNVNVTAKFYRRIDDEEKRSAIEKISSTVFINTTDRIPMG